MHRASWAITLQLYVNAILTYNNYKIEAKISMHHSWNVYATSLATAANVNIGDISNICRFVSEVSTSLRWCDCTHICCNTISTNNQKKFCICRVSWGEKYVCAVLFFFPTEFGKSLTSQLVLLVASGAAITIFQAACFMPLTVTQMDSTIVRLQHSLTGLSCFWTVGRAFGWLEGQIDTQRGWKSQMYHDSEG